MTILCAIGTRGGAGLVQRALAYAKTGDDLLLVHVIDTRPRHELDRLPGPLLRHGPRGGPERAHALDAAETVAGEQALAEAETVARDAGMLATTRLERGKPEQMIVAVAREAAATLIVIRARDWAERHPGFGPGSVGHTARFVLDHAPCDVLLVRQTGQP